MLDLPAEPSTEYRIGLDVHEEAPSIESSSEDSANLGEVLDWLQSYSDNEAPLSDDFNITPATVSNSVGFPDHSNIYTLEINNSEYRVLFPKDAPLDIVNGYLVNIGSNSVTGVVLDSGDSLSLSSYHSDFYTLYPVTSTSAQNNLYRYSASGYLTHYSSGVSSLQTTTTYANAEVLEKPKLGYNLSTSEFIIGGLLLILLLVNIIRSLAS